MQSQHSEFPVMPVPSGAPKLQDQTVCDRDNNWLIYQTQYTSITPLERNNFRRSGHEHHWQLAQRDVCLVVRSPKMPRIALEVWIGQLARNSAARD